MQGDAPPVARLQTREVVLGKGRAEVVADALLELEELGTDDGADRVTPQVAGAGTTVAVPIEPRERVGAADLERATEDVVLHRAEYPLSDPRAQRRVAVRTQKFHRPVVVHGTEHEHLGTDGTDLLGGKVDHANDQGSLELRGAVVRDPGRGAPQSQF